MKKANIELIDPMCTPTKTSKEAACMDVRARAIEYNEETGTFIVKLGFKATPPKGYKFVLVPRSGITNTFLMMQNSPGQGDEDFTGEYQIRFKCIPTGVQSYYYETEDQTKYILIYKEFPFQVGDRVGQIHIQKVEKFEWDVTEVLDETERGNEGFGSTGNK